MRRYPDTCRFGHTALAFILGLNLASCEGGGPAGPPAPTFALSSTSLVFAGPSQETQVTISNLRSEPLSWRVLASTASWLTAAPVTGSIEPGENGTLTVRINRSAVPHGTHSATLQIGAEDYSAPINVSVNDASVARAVLAPSSITLGPQEIQQTLLVSNTGNGSLNWSLTAPSWVSLDPKQGTLPSGR